MMDPHASRRATVFFTYVSDSGEIANCAFRVGDMTPVITPHNITKPDMLFLLESLKMVLDLDLADQAARDLELNPPEF